MEEKQVPAGLSKPTVRCRTCEHPQARLFSLSQVQNRQVLATPTVAKRQQLAVTRVTPGTKATCRKHPPAKECKKLTLTPSSHPTGEEVEETKCQSRMDLLENDLYLSASGAVNLDINTDFCPLLPEAKFPFLAIEKEKKLIQKHEIKQQIRTTNYLDWENQEHDFQNEEVSPKIFPQKTKGSHKEQDDLVWRKDPVYLQKPQALQPRLPHWHTEAQVLPYVGTDHTAFPTC
ncbi:hypothetical protein Anapl_04031 [Anas platyrhynchos]|uniref:Uncharacterized protein n=1 Tax=Anas platyrhynchos TaxID=8839 RepID=R0K9C9_ANAPL|nr:hypothetical protein Anapl_04031 [Anas platyrhynchos]